MKSGSNEYKTSLINNRRYLGNKYKLLPFIERVVNEHCPDIRKMADVFAGTGAVSSAFSKQIVYTNDIMYSNYICNYAWFGADTYNSQIIIDNIIEYNSINTLPDNYMSDNFSDTYFSRENCRKIGYIRDDIEDKFTNGAINPRERAILITSLLYAMDKIALTCGHYDAFRKDGICNSALELSVPLVPVENNKYNMCFNKDANELIRDISADLIYIDPPYNSRQYCDAYHLLENVARWEKPPVYGVAKKMDRSNIKSRYCTKGASAAFEDLIENAHADYILLSYNNMAQKGNDRSNAKISDTDIIRILNKKGTVQIFSESYKAFTTGKSDIPENEERLFLCTCNKR